MKKRTEEDLRYLQKTFNISEEDFKTICNLVLNYGKTDNEAYNIVCKTHEDISNSWGNIFEAKQLKENHESAYAIKNKAFAAIWSFFMSRNNLGKSFSVDEVVSQLPEFHPETVEKRISDLKLAGLLKVSGYGSYQNSAGRTVKFALLTPSCIESFDKIYPRLKFEVKAKDLKVNTVFKASFDILSDLLRDRSLTTEYRYKVISSYMTGLIHLVDTNPEVKDLINRYKTNPGTYDKISDFNRDFQEVRSRTVDVEELEDSYDSVDEMIQEDSDKDDTLF